MPPRTCRNLIVILGDQLDEASAVFRDMDPQRDWIWMAEVSHESTKVWSSKPRTAVFLAAMRHFRERLRHLGWTVLYRELLPEGAEWTGWG
ncbi:MAG: cryptochrome/photolyase family protein, partial [Verrucomicrobia bacterium]|nr:cryptochrome/photolyase family protein [Verrucomicrobiota bacterium]